MQKIIILFSILLFPFNIGAQNGNWKYLGQTPPGNVPEVFAPGIVSTEKLEHSSPVFTSDLKEVYWAAVAYPPSENIKTIYHCKYENGMWTKVEIASFSRVFSDDSPFIIGDKLYFSSNRNMPELDDSLKNLHWTLIPNSQMWQVELNGIKKYEPVVFNNPFKVDKKIMGLNITSNGNLYFLSHLEGVEQQCGIFFSEKTNTGYTNPRPLPESINSKFQDWTPYIAPDESYLIFSSTRNPKRNDFGDLYISFNLGEGKWSEAIYMGDSINTPSQERLPSVSPDGKYLFFTRWTRDNGQDVFWVSADIIHDFRSKLRD